MNTPTPETDATAINVAAFQWKDDEKVMMVDTDFARKLERERNEAIGELIRIKNLQKTTEKVWHGAEKELTKTRNELEQLREQLKRSTHPETPATLPCKHSYREDSTVCEICGA